MNTSFSQEAPNLQLAWDSTSLGLLKECPRKYQYQVVIGYQSRKMAVDLAFGLWVHAALEMYDHLRVAGKSYEEASYETIHWLLLDSKDFVSDNPNKNRKTLIRTIVWYMEEFREDSLPVITLANGKAAVELSFRMAIDLTSYTGEQFLLCGHMDKLAKYGEFTYVVDRKTTKSTINSDYFKRYSPDNQMSLYSMASKVVFASPASGVIVDAAQIAVGFTRFHRGFVNRTEAEQEEFLADTKRWLRIAEIFAQEGHWPMNDKSCSNYGGCTFRDICSKHPKVRPSFLETAFSKRTWDPLVPR